MKTEVILVKSFNENKTIKDFFEEIYKHPITRDFLISRLGEDSIRDKIKEYITENGISTLYNHHITCDAVFHPGITVDEIEDLVLGFIGKLKGVRNLLITDQYLYTDNIDCINLFEKIMLEICESLETITILINEKKAKLRTEFHRVLKKVSPNIVIKEIITEEFHDRFWIDIDNEKGIVIGTSLNGITKKIGLIDHLSKRDTREIIKLVNVMTQA